MYIEVKRATGFQYALILVLGCQTGETSVLTADTVPLQLAEHLEDAVVTGSPNPSNGRSTARTTSVSNLALAQ